MDDLSKKKLEGYEINNIFSNCSISSISTDGRLMAINDKYLAISWITKGNINVVDQNNPRNLAFNNYGMLKSENSSILDMEFSPFDSNILAYSNENGSVFLTNIKDEHNELKYNHNIYKKLTKKINFVGFNPITSNIMCSCNMNGELHIWDSKEFKTFVEYKTNNYPNAINWSPCGDLIGIGTKTRLFNVYDPRNKNIILEHQISEVFSYQKFAWLDNNSIACIGWDKKVNRLLSLLDIRKADKYYSSIIIDRSNNQATPFVNPEIKLIYSVGKDDFHIKVFDYSQGRLQKCLDQPCSEPNAFSISMNRRYLDKDELELDRFIRLTKFKNIYYVGFTFHNLENINFDEELYPNDEIAKPQLTSEQWLAGNNMKLKNQKEENKINEQNNNNNLKNINNINNNIQKGGAGDAKLININEVPKKPDISPQIKTYNNERAVNQCNNCYNLNKIIEKLEADKEALLKEKNFYVEENNKGKTEISKLNYKIKEGDKKYKMLSEKYNKLLEENVKLRTSLNNSLLNSRNNPPNNVLPKEKQIEEFINKPNPDAENFNNQISELKAKNNELKENLKKEQDKVKSMEEELDSIQRELLSVQAENEELEQLKNKFNDINKEKEQYENEINELKSKLIQMNNDNNKNLPNPNEEKMLIMEKENSELKKELENKNNELKAIINEKVIKEGIIQNKLKEISELKKIQNDLNIKHNKDLYEINSLKIELDKIKSEKAKIIKSEEMLNDLKSQNEELKAKNLEDKNKNESQLKLLNEKIRSYEQNNIQNKIIENNMITQYKQKIANLEKSIETKDREILDIIKTKEDIINEQKNKINDFEKDKANSINKLRQELEILKKGNNEKEQQILLLNTNMDNIKEENNKITKEKEIQISNLEEKIKLLKENDEKNKNMLKEKDNKISLLEQSQNTELDDINKKYNEIIFKLQKETKEKEKIISEKKELELNNSKLETQNIQNQKTYEELKKHYNEQQNDINKFKNEELNYNLQINNIEIEKAKLNNKINKLNNELKKKEEMIKINEKELNNIRNQNIDKENAINTEIKKIEDNYKKKYDEEIYKLQKNSNEKIEDSLNQTKKKYDVIYTKREKKFDDKFSRLNESLLNSRFILNREQNQQLPNINNNNLVNIDNNSFHQNNSNIINIQNNEVEQLSNISNQNNNNIINNNNINNNIINVSNVINVDNQNNEHPKNDEKLFTNTGTEIKGNNEQSAINTHNIINNFYNNNNNNVNESQNGKEEGYSFDCSNSMYLSVYISLGSDEAKFEIYLKNNGTKTWAPDSKLKIDKTSDCTVDEVILAPQKPNEERNYSITVKDLHNYPAGDYNVIFLFWSNENYHGEKIQAVIRIKKKENIESEIAEYIDKIKEFRDYYSLTEEDYPNDKILEALKENDFNYENAFSSIFN